MIRASAVRAVWLAAAVLVTVAMKRYRDEESRLWANSLQLTVDAPIEVPDAPISDDLADATERVVRAHPFRSDRAPASDDVSTVSPVVAVSPQIAPGQISLRGVVGGPPWTAVVQGLPGAQGTVVLRAGDTIAGFWILRAHKDTVVLRGLGTTLTLTLAAQ